MAGVRLSLVEMGSSPEAGKKDGHVETLAHFFVLSFVAANVTCTLCTGIVSASIFCGSDRIRWALHGVCGVGCGRAMCRHVSIPCVASRYVPQQGGGSPPTSVSKW
jgi:hypothetical protein